MSIQKSLPKTSKVDKKNLSPTPLPPLSGMGVVLQITLDQYLTAVQVSNKSSPELRRYGSLKTRK